MKALNINVAAALVELRDHVSAVERRVRDKRGGDWDVLRQQWPEMMRRLRAAKGDLFEDESKLKPVLLPGEVERTGVAALKAGDRMLTYARRLGRGEWGTTPAKLAALAVKWSRTLDESQSKPSARKR